MSIPISSSPCVSRYGSPSEREECVVPVAHANEVGLRLYFSKPFPDLPYPTSNRLGKRKDAPLTLELLLLVVAVSSESMSVLAAAASLLSLILFVLLLLLPRRKEDGNTVPFWFPGPQNVDDGAAPDDDDETDDRDEQEDDAILAAGTKRLFLVVPDWNVSVLDRFDAAAPMRKSNNSPNPEMGVHLFHSIVDTDGFFSSVDVVAAEDEERASCSSVKNNDVEVATTEECGRTSSVDRPGCMLSGGLSLIAMDPRERPSILLTTGGRWGYMRGIWIMILHR